MIKKFSYTILPHPENPSYFTLTILAQDPKIMGRGGRDLFCFKGWTVKVACSVEVNCYEKVIYIVGSSGMKHNSFSFCPSYNSTIGEIKKVLEEFRLKYCGQDGRPNHRLTKIFQ